MRPEESLVASALQKHLGGPEHVQFADGEDPPDIALVVKGRSVGVEVTRLSQATSDTDGRPQERATQDAFGDAAIRELDASLGASLPAHLQLILAMWMPVANPRKFKSKLKSWVSQIVTAATPDFEEERMIEGARVRVRVAARQAPGKAILGIVANEHSSPNISENAKQILHARITTKDRACRDVLGPIWLALLVDYWLADPATWQQALDSLSLKHRFERLFVVTWQGAITELK